MTTEKAGHDAQVVSTPDKNEIDTKTELSVAEGQADLDVEDVVNAAEQHEFSAEQLRKLLWKVDRILLPAMWVASGTQFADKVSIATQATFGLREDTGLVGQQYSWLTTIFYISFLVSEGPANYVLQRLALGPTVAISMFIWGVIVLCIAFAQNFTQLMVLRFLQGVAECTTYPALLILTASFYTKREHAMRSVIWGSSNSGMDIITSLINYGIGMEAQKHPGGLAAWRGISLFLGSLTIVLSFITYYVFGTPREVRWLNPEEKRMVAIRIVDSQTGTDAQKRAEWKWDQVKVAIKDPQTYFLFFLVLVNSIPNGGTTSFGNLVYVSFGFSALDTIVKGKIPQQLVSIIFFIIVGYFTLKKPNTRFLFMMASVVPSFVGMLALALLPKTGYLWARWAMFLITIFGNVAGPLIWTLVPSNIAGRTKKSVTSTVLFVAYCAGNSIGAQVFRAQDAPLYIPAIVVCSTMYGLEIVIMICWRAYYMWENKRRDKAVEAMGLTKQEAEHQGRLNAEMDMTDYENIHFRYSM